MQSICEIGDFYCYELSAAYRRLSDRPEDFIARAGKEIDLRRLLPPPCGLYTTCQFAGFYAVMALLPGSEAFASLFLPHPGLGAVKSAAARIYRGL